MRTTLAPGLLLLVLSPLALASCGEAVQDNHFAEDVRVERSETPAVVSDAVPVRIGELGPNFPACNATGVTRRIVAGQSLPVRSAPFDTAAETGAIAAGTQFQICSRSHDQKWFGVVFSDGADARSCGVTAPVPTRRAYEGPCRSGWVAAPYVKFTAGVESPESGESPVDSAT